MLTKWLGYSLVKYDQDTGQFHWVRCYRKPWMDGQIATREMGNGYLYIKGGGKSHSASRLAYELFTGEPVLSHLVVDHINRDRRDNRPENLRAISQKENLENSVRPIGVSGFRGIRAYNRPSGNGRLWRINTMDGVKYFQTLDEAIAGYAKLVRDRL
jgi:hypothetical protein